MKIAIPYENGNVFAHFGRTAQFKIYNVDLTSRTVLDSEIIDTDGFGHGTLAELLNDNAVELVLCGGLGGCAQNSLYEYGIQFLGGLSGPVDAVIEAFLSQTLNACAHPECCGHDGCGHGGENGENACGQPGCGGHCGH